MVTKRLQAWWTNNPRLVWGLLLLLGVVFGNIATQHGALYFPDEHRYFWNSHSILVLLLGKISPAQQAAVWREGLSVIGWHLQLSPIAWLNFMLHGLNPVSDFLGLAWVERSWLWLYTGVNIGCYLATVMLMAAITKHVIKNDKAPWLAALLTLVWPPLWIWMRHVVPYPLALVWGLLSLWALLKGRKESGTLNTKWILASGIAFAISFLTYPGFYYLGVIHALILLSRIQLDHFKTVKQTFFNSLLWLGPLGTLLIATDVLSRHFFDLPYLAYWQQYLPTMVQGDFSEGFWLTLGYPFFTITGWLAVMVFMGVFGMAAMVQQRGWNQAHQVFSHVVAKRAGVAMLGLLSFISTGLHQTVIYGRTLLPLSLWWVLQLVGFIVLMQRCWRLEARGVTLMIGILFVFLGWSCWETTTIAYPMDLILQPMGHIEGVKTQQLNQLYLHTGKIPDGGVMTQPFKKGTVVLIDGKTHMQHDTNVRPLGCNHFASALANKSSVYLAVNRGYMYPLGQFMGIHPMIGDSSEKIIQQPHPMNSHWYQFEGFTPTERAAIRQGKPMMQLFINPCSKIPMDK